MVEMNTVIIFKFPVIYKIKYQLCLPSSGFTVATGALSTSTSALSMMTSACFVAISSAFCRKLNS